MADAYKVKADTSFPSALRKVEEFIDGQEVYETVGVAYSEGDYVLAEALTPRDRERAANGELDHLLEPADREEAEAALNPDEKSVFIAEHGNEAFILQEYGHEVVPREQVLELKSAGADAAREVLEAAKSEGLDERDLPGVYQEEHLSEEAVSGLEQPPGVVVGDTKEAAEQSNEVEAPKRATRRGTSTRKQEKVAQEEQKKQDEKSE